MITKFEFAIDLEEQLPDKTTLPLSLIIKKKKKDDLVLSAVLKNGKN